MRLRNFESRVFIALVLLTTGVFLWLIRGFLVPVFWAAVFALLFQPVFVRLTRSFKGKRGAAAGVTVLVVVLVLLIPTAFLLAVVAQQALSLYQRVSSGQVDLDAPVKVVERYIPRLTDMLSRYGIDVDRVRAGIQNAAVNATQYIGGKALLIGQNALSVALLVGVMLYVLFFFLRDGDRITKGVVRAIPMGDARERRLIATIAQVSRATVKGTVVVAAVQGALGGITFALVGIQDAVFWTVVMAVLSLIPAVGAAIVWVPAAIILFATGAVWKGVVVVLSGTLVIGTVDNLLRPILVGASTKLPDYLVLLATLGGVSMFGLAGFVAGPLIAAVFLVMWEMFADEFAPLDSSEPPAA